VLVIGVSVCLEAFEQMLVVVDHALHLIRDNRLPDLQLDERLVEELGVKFIL